MNLDMTKYVLKQSQFRTHHSDHFVGVLYPHDDADMPPAFQTKEHVDSSRALVIPKEEKHIYPKTWYTRTSIV